MMVMPEFAQKIVPFLWFDTQAKDAAKFYTSIFDNSRIKRISRYGKAGHKTHGKQAGSVLTVEFELEDRAQRRPASQIQRSGFVPGVL
jgi:predicted 3-demethylubiquinone-9 3-methyltransferase (glyoxalase superfamily)